MKIALIADIHSNQFAFLAVLNHLKNKNIDQIIFLGDYAFGGSSSNESVDLLMNYNAHPFVAITGNKEGYITPIEQKADWIVPVLFDIYDELGSERISYLKSLPAEISLQIEEVSIHVCHNLPNVKAFTVVDRLKREKNYPNREELAELAIDMEDDIFIFGHHHLFMDETINDKRFICASSVGMPLNGDPRAQYMILDINKGNIITTKQFVEYDRLELVEDFKRKGYFEKYDNWSMNTLVTMLTAHNYIGTQDLRK